MNTLIVKLGATGDVVRTSSLLRKLTGDITWITERKNMVLLEKISRPVRCLSWEQRDKAGDRKYDLVINLEDTLEVGLFVKQLEPQQIFGAYVNGEGRLAYTDNARRWFDLSLIS